MATYAIRATDGVTYMRLNLSDAAAPIIVGYEDEDEGIRWDHSPHQVADARHDLHAAALLALQWAYRNGGWIDAQGFSAKPGAADIESVIEVPISRKHDQQ